MTTDFFAIFWGMMIFASIAWYGFLLFYIGYKGGREIFQMIKVMEDRAEVETSAIETPDKEAGTSSKK